MSTFFDNSRLVPDKNHATAKAPLWQAGNSSLRKSNKTGRLALKPSARPRDFERQKIAPEGGNRKWGSKSLKTKKMQWPLWELP